MTQSRVLTGAVVMALVLAAAVGATTFNLPDLALAAGGSAQPLALRYSVNGLPVAAINVNIRYDDAVAEPQTGGIAVGPAVDGTWTVRSNNIEDAQGTLDELRIVLYHDPTLTFATTQDVILTVPWAPVGAAGAFTLLDIQDSGPAPSGASDNGGNTIAHSWIDGAIHIINFPTPNPIGPGEDGQLVTNLTNWISFQQLPFPFDEADPMNPGSPRPPPYMNVSPNGSSPITIGTTADENMDGVAGWVSTSRIPYTANSVYLVEWTIASQLVGDPLVNTMRLRVREEVENCFSELNITPFSIAAPDGAGTPKVYPQFFEPSDLSGNLDNAPTNEDPYDELYLQMDITDFSSAGFDEQAATTTVSAVDVTRFDKPAVDTVFNPAFTVTNFGDLNQWDIGLFGTGDPDSDGVDEIVVPPLTTGSSFQFEVESLLPNPLNLYQVTPSPGGGDPGNVLITTPLGDAEPETLGVYQEFGTNANAGLINDDVVWRQRVTMQSPTGSDPDLNSTFRLRFTEELQTISSTYQVLSVGGRGTNFVSTATGINRPPPEPSSITYNNYWAYPAGSDVESLQDTTFNNNVQAFVGIIDFETPGLPPEIQGQIRITGSEIQTAPRNALLP